MHSFRCHYQSLFRSLKDWSSCMFPTEGDRVCSWLLQWSPTNREHCAVALLQKGPSVPRTWPSCTGLRRNGETERDAQGWCGPAGLQNKPPPISISTHPPSAASQQPAAYPATSIPMTACQRSAHSQGKKRERERENKERRREMVRRALSSRKGEAVKRVVRSSDRKALTTSMLLLFYWGQSESTLPHYHWDTVRQRREEGKLCDT